jgi:hypothetical protein
MPAFTLQIDPRPFLAGQLFMAADAGLPSRSSLQRVCPCWAGLLCPAAAAAAAAAVAAVVSLRCVALCSDGRRGVAPPHAPGMNFEVLPELHWTKENNYGVSGCAARNRPVRLRLHCPHPPASLSCTPA